MGLIERWKEVRGVYAVSSHGRVKRLARNVIRRNGWPFHISEKTPSGVVTKDGYLKVSLRGDGLVLTEFVHRLVMAAFVGPCPDGMRVNHIDGNRLNNNVDNLEYVQ